MTMNRVVMIHPGTKARIDAPEQAVKIYEASGWTVAPDDTAEGSGTEKAPRKAVKEEGK